MTREEFIKLQKLARNVCHKFKCPELADDLTQEVYIEYSRGRETSVKNICIDLIRREYGRTGVRGEPSKRGFRLKGRARFTSIEALQKRIDDEGGDLSRFIPAFRVDPDSVENGRRFGDDDRRQLKTIAAEEGCWVTFHEAEGDQREEIAFARGVTPSRISQIAKRERKKIERRLIWDEFLPIYKNDKEQGKLLIEWIAF